MTPQDHHRHHPWRLTLLSGLLAAQFAFAQPTTPVAIDIPAQPLAAALAKFAEQSGLKTLYAADLLAGKTAPRVQGQLSPADALQRLLAGNGLRFRAVGIDAVAIEAIPGGEVAPTTLRPVAVRATGVAGAAAPGSYSSPVASSATKTDTPLIVTPVVVTVIPQEALKDQQATSLSEALTNASGVWSYSRGQGCDGTCEAINMRGFSQFGNVMSDGFITQSAGGLTNLSNVEAIEVIKGPASILYGRMEPGGAVNIITKKPQSVASRSIDLTVGSLSTTIANFDLTGPVNDDKSLLYRVNGTWDQHDLYTTRLKNERKFIAPSLQWNLSPQTQALLEVTYDENQYPWQRELYPQDPVTLQPVYFPWSGNITPYRQQTDTTVAKLGVTHAFNDAWTGKLQARASNSKNSTDPNSWSVGWMDQQAGEWRIWRTRADGYGSNDQRALQLDLTGRLEAAGAKHTLLLGADASRTKAFSTSGNSLDAAAFDYFYDITSALNPVAPTAALQINAWWGTHTKETRNGVYLQDQVELPGNVHVLAGLRRSSVTFDSQDEVSGVWVTDFGVDPLKVRATRKDSAVTPRLGVLWEFRPGTSLYASYSENFGNYQAVFDWQGNALDPQLAKQKEIGLKHQSADGKLSAAVAIYDLRKTNVAVEDPDHTGCRDSVTGFAGTPDVSPCYLAAGLTRARGIEFDVVGEVMPGWNLIANYSYNSTRVLEDGLAPADTWAGKRVGYYPAHMGKLATTYKIRAGMLQGWKLGGAITYTGSTDLGSSSPQQTVSPAYTLFDAMASYELALGDYKCELQLNVKNLTDKRYVITASEGFFTSRGVGDPRTVLARLKVNF